MIAYIIAGLLVGFAVGTTGVGGGALMTPILIFFFGLPAAVAVGTDLLFAAVTKGFGTALHGAVGTVRWRIACLMLAGSIPASMLTIYFLSEVGLGEDVERTMLLSLGIAIALTAFGVLFRNRIQRASQSESLAGLKRLHRQLRTPATIVSGVLLGVLVTLSSVGAGVIGAMLLLLLYPRLRAIEVVGTDLAHAVPLTAVAGLGHFHLGTTDLSLLGYLLMGSIPGIYLGTRLGFKLPDEILRPVLAAVLLVIGTGLVYRALT